MKRSNEASAYRWAVVIMMIRKRLADEGFVYTKEEVNYMMKLKTGFYVGEMTDPWGEVIKYEIPTGSLKTKEAKAYFESWMSAIREYAYEYLGGLDIPTPNSIPIEQYGE